ncbi:MAG: tryptophan--tRNA ligase [bacterium]|nr:tryptophan--tRNA ligase [bacterium]
MSKKRIISGIQSSGSLHLGNYVGALRQFIELQEDYECFFFIADLHSITVPQEPETLRTQIRDTVATYLACGIDPDKAVLFRQSEIAAHAELGWLLNTIATMGELKRMTQYKDKASGEADASVGVGLFDYPVLMAADILLYRPEAVPVGEDQKQHIELTRDLAERFNGRFGETFRVPEPLIPEGGARIMALDDPKKKMSKSTPSEASRIELTDDADIIRRKVFRAVTDSGDTVVGGPDKPALTNLLAIMGAMSGKSVAELEQEFRGKGYKEFKEALAETVITALESIQKRYAELEQDSERIDAALAAGAERARPIAEATLADAKRAMGLR